MRMYTERAKRKVLRKYRLSKLKLKLYAFFIVIFIVAAVLCFKKPAFTFMFIVSALAVMSYRPFIKHRIEKYSYYAKEGILFAEDSVHASGLPVEKGVSCRLELRESACRFKTPDRDYEIKYKDIDSVEIEREETSEPYLEYNQEINYVSLFKTQVKTTAEVKERVVDTKLFLVINYKSRTVKEYIILEFNNIYVYKTERLLKKYIRDFSETK